MAFSTKKEWITRQIKPEANSDEKHGASSATGDYGASVVTGYKSVSYAGNETAIAVAWGIESSAKGIKGATLVLSEWVVDDNKYVLKDTRLVRVDGEIIKEDVAYTLKDGKVVEA